MNAEQFARFDRELTRLLPEGGPIGVAVSGGPDSLALLLLAAEVRPGEVEAATVNHGLRPESAAEAVMVESVCAHLAIPHATLTVAVPPGASLQAQARGARYTALSEWAADRNLVAILTAHHADDQAETLLMRLARGAGLSGLSGIRERNSATIPIIRPLLAWRRSELEAIVSEAGLTPVSDPSNLDPRHDRSRVREFLAAQQWLGPERLAASASHLAEAEQALAFAAERLFAERHTQIGETVELAPADLPKELQRRLLLLTMARFGADTPRGPDLERALQKLIDGKSCNLAGLQFTGGERWKVRPESPRR